MQIPKYIVFRVDVMRKGTSMELTNITDDVEDVILKAEQTEPQYDIDKGTIKCDNCSENGTFKCSKCDGEMYFKRLEPKDEPQTECTSCDQVGRCERGRAVECPLTERSE